MPKRRYTWESFPTRLTYARFAANLSHAALAARTGLAPSTLASYERGESTPPLHRLDDLANALATSIDWLLGRTEDDLFRRSCPYCTLPPLNLAPRKPASLTTASSPLTPAS